MRVGINALFLARPQTGTGRYTRRLLEGLGELQGGCDCVAIGTTSSAGRWPGLKALKTPFDRRREGLAKLYFEQIAFPRACQREGVDLAHYPYFAAPMRSAGRVVATVHDLVPMLFPQYRANPAARFYTSLVAAGYRRASLLVTDSLASQRDIVRMLGVPAGRVRVVYLAPDEQFRPGAPAGAVVAARRRYQLPDDFVLYLGGLDYRKNVPRLLEALALLGRRGVRPSLVVAGVVPRANRLFPDVRRLVADLGLPGQVTFCGPIADEDQPVVYQAATAFVYPSLYEGFGLPPLEAMACGTPVVCSNAASLPEVVGDAAVTCDPTDVAALAETIARVFADADLRADLRRRGQEQAARFSWSKVARQTLDAYAAAVR